MRMQDFRTRNPLIDQPPEPFRGRLRLELRKQPVDFWVVDRAEKPAED
jgi:hypothetical protein